MEVLNQNQRRSAIWRLVSIGVLVAAILAVIVASLHKAYASQGTGEIALLKESHEKDLHALKVANQELINQNHLSNQKIKELEAQLKNPDKEMQILRARLEQKDDRIKVLKDDFDTCKGDLRACQSQAQQ